MGKPKDSLPANEIDTKFVKMHLRTGGDALLAYRTAVSSATGYSPFYICVHVKYYVPDTLGCLTNACIFSTE